MKFAKVTFGNNEDAAKALQGLMQRGRVTVLRDHSFIVPAPALDWLAAEGVPYTLVQWMNQDDVVSTVRSRFSHVADLPNASPL